MDTLFFVISIFGFVAITFWAYHNDQCASVAEQNGILAMKVVAGPDTDTQAQDSQPNLTSPPDAERSPAPRKPPPRRRFISS